MKLNFIVRLSTDLTMQYIDGLRSFQRRWRRAIALTVALAVLPVAWHSQAYTVTVLMPVRMDVIGVCTISATNLDFGNYLTRENNPTRGTAILNLVCPSERTVEIALDAGTAASRNTRRRQLSAEAGRGTLDYDLFKNGDRNQHWGDKDEDTLVLRATGGLQAIEVYGEIPARQVAPDGSYVDIIIVTVSF